MDTVAEAVEVFQGPGEQLRCRLVIGYVLLGGHLYYMQKKGAIWPMTAAECEEQYAGDWAALLRATTARLEAAVQRTWQAIPPSGELIHPVYAWELGAPYETDDDGDILGNWPEIGTLTLRYEAKFLMPGGQIPEAYRGIRLWRLGRR